ncbi:MAG: hypothetical protein ACJAWL_001044 [Motiliproteus sp.]|jgi:hypothetical protein
MKLRDEPLHIPLATRNYNGVLFVIACIGLGILNIKPSTPEAWVIAIGVMAPTFWLIFIGPKFLDTWQRRSRYAFVGWLILIAKLSLFMFVIKVVVPFMEQFFTEWLHA